MILFNFLRLANYCEILVAGIYWYTELTDIRLPDIRMTAVKHTRKNKKVLLFAWGFICHFLSQTAERRVQYIVLERVLVPESTDIISDFKRICTNKKK